MAGPTFRPRLPAMLWQGLALIKTLNRFQQGTGFSSGTFLK
jgi:hypothetical protein